jgi:hypothetical protein
MPPIDGSADSRLLVQAVRSWRQVDVLVDREQPPPRDPCSRQSRWISGASAFEIGQSVATKNATCAGPLGSKGRIIRRRYW